MTRLRDMSTGVAIAWAMGGIVAVLLAFATALSWWIGSLAVAAALAFARVKRWPKVHVRYYLTTLKIALPAAAGVFGVGTQELLEHIHHPAPAIAWGAFAAGGLIVFDLILEGKVMKSVFDLVPQDQRAALDGFVAGQAPVGQRADLSRLDPEYVIASIKDRLIGQDRIIDELIPMIFRRARLGRPNKPIATAMFVGATGAGKTELAKAVADTMFDGRMIRVDLNEFTTDASTQRLVGAPPGYMGSDKGGWLCRELARVGTGVLLFDECEKAHPAVLKLIMSLLDEARLTEQSTGQTFSATGFVILLTSNLRQAEIARIAETATDKTERDRAVRDEIKAGGFAPENVARLDAIFPFAPLSRRDLTEIVGRFLMRFAADAGVTLTAVDAPLLIDLVTRAEKMRDYGVREVVRAVESAVVDGLLVVKDRGCNRAAIRVIDGHVMVQPVAAEGQARTAGGVA